jgi:tetratricopeptide (TPR) repeat protein
MDRPAVSKLDDHEASQKLYAAGRRAMDAGDLQRAVNLFEASITALPHFKSLELLGECLLRLGRPKEAIVPLAAATALNRQVRPRSFLAQALAKTGDADRARELVRSVLSEAPGNRLARQVLETLRPGSDIPEDPA